MTEGLHIPVDGGITAFPNICVFMTTWMTYASIRSSFASDRAPGLTHWTERLIQYSLKFERSYCLSYAIEYFTKHQNAPLAAWFSVDPEIVIGHFIAIKQISSHNPTKPASTAASSQHPQSPKMFFNGEVCQNWNRPILGCTYQPRFEGDKCPHRHIP